MNTPKRSNLWLLPILALALGCDAARNVAPAPRAPGLAILDGANGGNQRLFFLPPLVKLPSYSGIFDADAPAVVEICKLATPSACGSGPLVASYSMTSGSGGEIIKVDGISEHYHVKWRTADFSLDDGGTYRVSVKHGSSLLGYADVQIFTSSQQAKNSAEDQIIALLDGHILNIKFRIEQGTATATTIDARALTAPTVEIPNVRTFSPANVQEINLEPGTYLLRYHTGGLAGPGDAEFSVSADHTVDYSVALDGMLSGRGTSTLTLKGAVVTVDLKALTAPAVDMPGVSNSMFSTTEVQTVTLLPGGHLIRYHTGALGGLASAEYRVLNDGTIDYATSLEGVFSGRGTSALTVNGSTVTIDVTALTAPVVDMPGVSSSNFPTAEIHSVTLLPGGHLIRYHTGALAGLASVEYRVLDDGTLDYAVSLESVLLGRGTLSLEVRGLAISIDATALSSPTFVLPGIGTFGTTAAQSLRLLPGGHRFQSSDRTFEFLINAAGSIDYDTVLNTFLDGVGTSAMTVH